MLDVGTNNKKLLNDLMYMGAKHQRIDQEKYDEFLDLFIQATKRRWPEIMIQFEDFAQPNAMPLLNRYREEVCCFNDDIQGTAAVTLGTILAACRTRGNQLSSMKVVFVGSGSAGCGIAEMLVSQMCFEGLSDSAARKQIFMVDRNGLLTQGMKNLRDFQSALQQPLSAIEDWYYSNEYASLIDVINHAKPDILIGVSGQAGLFTEHVVRSMKQHCQLPIIFPLSNPSKQVEATPDNIIKWTDGEVVVATGSPFSPVKYNNKIIHIAQCNNSYIFPGIGLGVIACKSRIISDEMLMAASNVLADASPQASCPDADLLPPMTEISELSRAIAFAVAKVAMEQELALQLTDEVLLAKIEANFWRAEYRTYKRVSV